MTQRPIKQLVSDHIKKSTEKTTQYKTLAKLQSKLQQANTFISNPSQLSPAIEKKHEQDEKLQHEPWMQNDDPSVTVRKEKNIKNQIANLLAEDEQEQKERRQALQLSKITPHQIISKMKKYQPANSSFSTLYGQKKNIERHSGKQQLSEAKRNKLLNLPPLNLRGHSNHNRTQHQQRLQALSSSRQTAISPPRQPQKFRAYLGVIKQIYKQGSSLHHKSQTLIHRIDKISDFLSNRFELFSQQSQDMLSDVGSYKLEEETSGEYKRNMLTELYKKIKK